MLPLRDENPHPPGFKPKLTIALIIINVIIFFYEVAVTGQFFDFAMVDQNGVYPNTIKLFYDWGAVPFCISGGTSFELRFVEGMTGIPMSCPSMPMVGLLSSMFLHGGLMHLGGNMLFLWIFGDNIELKFGRTKFLGIYLFWGLIASLAHYAIEPMSIAPAVGASGAISGILGAYLALYPRVKIMTFMMLGFFWRMLHIEARWFLPFWLIFQNILPFVISGFGVAGGGVAFMAHIGGFLIGLATGYLYKKTHSSEFSYGSRYGWRGDR